MKNCTVLHKQSFLVWAPLMAQYYNTNIFHKSKIFFKRINTLKQTKLKYVVIKDDSESEGVEKPCTHTVLLSIHSHPVHFNITAFNMSYLVQGSKDDTVCKSTFIFLSVCSLSSCYVTISSLAACLVWTLKKQIV